VQAHCQNLTKPNLNEKVREQKENKVTDSLSRRRKGNKKAVKIRKQIGNFFTS